MRNMAHSNGPSLVAACLHRTALCCSCSHVFSHPFHREPFPCPHSTGRYDRVCPWTSPQTVHFACFLRWKRPSHPAHCI